MSNSELKLHKYQEDAVKFLQEAPGGRGLFLDMGLGKTAITLSALTTEHLPALVIAPKRVAMNVWGEEARKWRPDLKVIQCTGSPRARRDGLENPNGDIYVISRDVQSDAEGYAKMKRFRTLILDELSGYKNKSSKRWKSANRIRKDVVNCWGLTGTPTPNSLLDLWAQVAILDRGVTLGRSLAAFRERWFEAETIGWKGYVTKWRALPGADVRVFDMISHFCMSMKTDGKIDLPPVFENDVIVELPANARKAYNQMRKDLVVEASEGAVHSASTAAVMTGKLSQISAGFIYPDVDDFLAGAEITKLHNEKAKAVLEIYEGTGSPLLVFYRFRAELEELKATLPAGVLHTSDEKGVFDAWNAGEIPVLAAHPASIGHGLNLQHGGHTIVWTTLPWSTEEWEQANKRLSRQGQKRPVTIHKVMARNTIDSIIDGRLKGKETAQNALMSYLQDF